MCRSPFLQLALQRELDARRPDGGAAHRRDQRGHRRAAGQPMDDRAAAQAAAYGVWTPGFVARQLTAPMVAEADLVLTATRTHRGEVATLHPKALRYIFTFADFADLAERARGRRAGRRAAAVAGAAGPRSCGPWRRGVASIRRWTPVAVPTSSTRSDDEDEAVRADGRPGQPGRALGGRRRPLRVG